MAVHLALAAELSSLSGVAPRVSCVNLNFFSTGRFTSARVTRLVYIIVCSWVERA